MKNMQDEIDQLLSQFRKKCGIENSCGDLVGNLQAELKEAVEATEFAHKAEEFADIYIIAANAVKQLGVTATCSSGVHGVVVSHCADLIQDEIDFFTEAKVNGYGLGCIMQDSKVAIELLGYNPEAVILEKCKLINTRTGKMNEEGTKWCKDKNQDPATLYKMDIEGCKL